MPMFKGEVAVPYRASAKLGWCLTLGGAEAGAPAKRSSQQQFGQILKRRTNPVLMSGLSRRLSCLQEHCPWGPLMKFSNCKLKLKLQIL